MGSVAPVCVVWVTSNTSHTNPERDLKPYCGSRRRREDPQDYESDMTKVRYEIRDSESDSFVSSGEKEFENDEQYYAWLRASDGHPFLYIFVVNKDGESRVPATFR